MTIQYYLKKMARKYDPRVLSFDPLTRLALKHGTDKWGRHRYTPIYHSHFKQLRDRPLTILEIGVGGHANPHGGGASHRMWKEYFPHGTIYGIDIHDKREHEEERIKIWQGDQNDPSFLRWVAEQTGPLDIIIDDGSHVSEHIITSFQTLFSAVKNKGIYVIEDLQTSYWPSFGGSSTKEHNTTTTIDMLKERIDGLHYPDINDLENSQRQAKLLPSYFDTHIAAMHFYRNLAFIFKGKNNENL